MVAKEAAEIRDQEIRFFHGGEVATVLDVGPAFDPVVRFDEPADANVVRELRKRGWHTGGFRVADPTWLWRSRCRPRTQRSRCTSTARRVRGGDPPRTSSGNASIGHVQDLNLSTIQASCPTGESVSPYARV